MNAHPKKLILQRIVAHYRVPLFAELAQSGWEVLSAENFPVGESALHTENTPHPFQNFIRFWFPKKSNPYLCHVPFFKILKQYKPELLLMEAGSTMTSTWIAAFYCRLKNNRNTKIVLWGHGALVANKSGFKSKIATRLKTWLINSVDGYLCYTNTDKSHLDNLPLKTPTFSAGNTIDISNAQTLRVRPQKHNAKNFLFVGRLTEDKKVPDLIELFKKLPNAHLTIIGDGPLKNQLNTVPNITITDAIYDESKLAEHYNNADAYITLGAVGLGVNHALAYGLPVICYKESETGPHHHPEIAYVKNGQTGVLMTPHTQEAAFKCISDIMTKPLKHGMFKSITSYADTQLSIQSMAQNILEMETKILKHENN